MATQRHHSCFVSFVTLSLVFFLCLGTSSVAVAGISTDGSLGAKGPLAGPNYQIPDTLGQTRGKNLFHSFGSFNINTNESATFTGPSSIQNVISRVTGGSPSSIDGILSCTIPGANLYMMNPSGVMFGPNASLDVKGSFHVTTADYLKFSDGGIFYADLAKSSVLSVADPQAFGFLSANPAAISVDRSVLTVPDGQTLSIVLPEVGVSSPPRIFSSVDLPEPEGPNRTTNSRSKMSRSILRSACTATSPMRYVFDRLRARNTSAGGRSGGCDTVGNTRYSL